MRSVVLLVVTLVSCSADRETAPAPETKAKAPAPAKVEPVAPDPVVVRICEAFVDVHEHNKSAGDGKILQRTAARALQLGVNEGQIDAVGATPPQMLASIRARGNPPECTALVAYLKGLE